MNANLTRTVADHPDIFGDVTHIEQSSNFSGQYFGSRNGGKVSTTWLLHDPKGNPRETILEDHLGLPTEWPVDGAMTGHSGDYRVMLASQHTRTQSEAYSLACGENAEYLGMHARSVPRRTASEREAIRHTVMEAFKRGGR